MNNTLANGLFLLGVVVLGFLLSVGNQWLQDRKTTKSVRTLIRLELESQKQLLSEWWDAVQDQHMARQC